MVVFRRKIFDYNLTGRTLAVFAVSAVVLCVVITSICVVATQSQSEAQTWRGSHVLDDVPLIDGHNDLPHNLYRVKHNRLNTVDLDANFSIDPIWTQVNDPQRHTDIPKLRKGKVGAEFWVAYSPCKSLDKDSVGLAMEQIDVIKRMVQMYSETFEFVQAADGILEAFGKGKIASLIGVEGGQAIDNRLGVLRLFYELGVRYMTLTHTCTLPWADASPVDADEKIVQHGLTAFGGKVIAEMNRLGMMVDLSHVSKQTMLDVLNVTQAPVIFSHSNAWSVFQHHRNVQDDVLDALKRNNGIIMVNFYPGFLGNNTMEKVIEHLNYIKARIGIDHIGIGADFDGVPTTPIDLNDVSYYPDLFDRLAEDGHGWVPWTGMELQQLAGLNLIRVFKAVEAVRDSLRWQSPIDDLIPLADLTRDNPNQSCRSDLATYADGYLPPEVKIPPTTK